MATVRDLVEASMREIGVLAASETASAQEATDAFNRLNRYIDRLATENLTIYTITRSTWAITSGVGTYTVGPGQTVNIARPIFIEKISYADIGVTPPTPEYPLNKLTEAAWQAITFKELTGPLPQAWYYNPTYPNGTLSIWPVPIPSSGLQGVIYAWTALTQFASLDTAVALPPAYEEMLMSNLAVLLCPTYERQPHPVTVKVAADSMASLKRANQRLVDLTFDPAVLATAGRRHYDIRES